MINKKPKIPVSFSISRVKLWGWLSHTLFGKYTLLIQLFLKDLMPLPNIGSSMNKSNFILKWIWSF